MTVTVMDLLVNNYTLHQNLLWQNNGDGTVSQVATAARGERIGLAPLWPYDWRSLERFRQRGWIWSGELAHPRFDFSDKTQVLLNQGDGTFSDIQGDWTTGGRWFKISKPIRFRYWLILTRMVRSIWRFQRSMMVGPVTWGTGQPCIG